MATFNITNKISGHTFGDYEGSTAADALDAMARDAGYRNYADACKTFSDGGDLIVVEVQ